MDILVGAGVCGGTFDIGILGPTNMCYIEYDHSMTDKFGDTPLVPLDFKIPRLGASQPTFDPLNGQPFAPVVSSATDVDGAPIWQVHVDATQMPPTMPASGAFAPPGGAPEPFRTFAVHTTFEPIHGHDNIDPGLITRTAVKLATDQSCSADKTDDIVLYVTVNGQTKRMDPRSTAGLDFTANVRANDTLAISTSGFECDFSCGEHPADVLNSPNDRIGSVEMAFTGPAFGGTGTIGGTKTYRMKSQTNNTNNRSKVLTMGDYAIKATIKELPAGSQ